ncbi:hypothetical protein NM688_g184 [Phlebia brevispora]|uniref:Uncharacterized protein n=1 Tax=Phlebia brevispora TaxID=194682 RepID=A0ACC1TFS9_9APHY|nr:hypothetical protein NM688_g184 [Phlebia brevispora]
MPPIRPNTVIGNGSYSRTLAARAASTIVSHNPTLFYTAIGLCCAALGCGTIYLIGVFLGSWKSKGDNYPQAASGSRTDTACGDAAQVQSWTSQLWLKAFSGASEASLMHVQLRSPPVVNEVVVQAAPSWAERHIARSRSLDVYAVPIPDIPVATSRASAVVHPDLPGNGKLAGLGFGAIPFTACQIQSQEEAVALPKQEHCEWDEIDITEHSYSIYSQESSDTFSPYLPIYEVSLAPSPPPVFVVGSPGLPSPAIGAEYSQSYSSLAYLKQEAMHGYTLDSVIDADSKDEGISPGQRRTSDMIEAKARTGKQSQPTLSQANKENAMVAVQ